LAHHKASKKAIRQSARRNALNRSYKSRVRSAVKQLETANGPEEKAKSFRLAQQIIDRAARKGIIKRNTASRKISQLSKTIGPAKP